CPIANEGVGLERRPAREVADRGEAASRLRQGVVRGATRGERSPLPEACIRQVDQRRIDLPKLTVAESELTLHRAGLEVLDDDVGAGDQLLEDSLTIRLVNVEPHV